MPSPVIGVFDSGFGGLTVLRALLPLIPGARYVYLGDTARLPYGAKSRETIVRYAVESARFLLAQGAEMLVVACNTASALALKQLQDALPIPVIGVIEPGVRAASAMGAGGDRDVLVLATSATVESHAYAQACAATGLRATEKACPLLVPLVEEGWLDAPEKVAVTRTVLRVYLGEALASAPASGLLLLGCTHYPLLAGMIEETLLEMGHLLRIVDSARAVAEVVQARVAAGEGEVTCAFFATDSVEKFARLGSRFLGRPVEQVQLVDLGG